MKPIVLRDDKRTLSVSERKREIMQSYLMILFPLVGFLVLQVYPILWTFKWAFYAYNKVPSETRFIGLENFKTMFTTDLTYWKAWGNTLQFAIMKIPVELSLALFLAVLLNQNSVKCKGFFRSIYYLPNIISIVIVGLILTNLFNYNGFVNATLIKFGILKDNVNWFADRGMAMTMLVFGSIWNTFGINVMYFIAALSNVPDELYESAEIDGANFIVKFFKITIPMIAPVFQTIILLSMLGTLGVNEYIIALTNGAPSGGTRSVMSYLTTNFVPGFMLDVTPQLGYGCAMALVTTIIFGLLSFGYQMFSKKMNSLC